MTLTIYDLTHEQRTRIHALYDDAKQQFPEITTAFDIWLNPDDKEHILVNVNVPFYDNDREIEFGEYTAGLSCETQEQSGVLISLMPNYVPDMQTAEHHEAA